MRLFYIVLNRTSLDLVIIYLNIKIKSNCDYLNWPGAGPNIPPPCLLAALDGAKPSIF